MAQQVTFNLLVFFNHTIVEKVDPLFGLGTQPRSILGILGFRCLIRLQLSNLGSLFVILEGALI